jgi:hypothetical protein
MALNKEYENKKVARDAVGNTKIPLPMEVRSEEL